jgi:hypothetical protein
MNNIILAIDLGKYKSVACILDPTSGEFRFTSFETTRAELRKPLHEAGFRKKAAGQMGPPVPGFDGSLEAKTFSGVPANVSAGHG